MASATTGAEPLRQSDHCGLLRCRVAWLARTLAVTELSVARPAGTPKQPRVRTVLRRRQHELQ